MPLVDQPHHDGSRLYVGDAAPASGDRVAVRIRVPDSLGATAVHVRTLDDGEPQYRACVAEERKSGVTWWQGEVPVAHDDTRYRFLLETTSGVRWLNGAGTFSRDVADRDDFRIVTFAGPPAWLGEAVGYQIFPDRFARATDPVGRREPDSTPDWAIEAEWDTPVLADGRRAVHQLYRGDLAGIVDHLDHLELLGVNLIYLTPFFPGRSSHRYDASTFDHVDPMLGGDDALTALVGAAHERGIRVIGDLTTNHSGNHHGWFEAARAGAASPEASYYFFTDHPDGYVGWFGLASLPKFDLRSSALRRRLIEGADSVVHRWLEGSSGLDGWRIDVANMTGRLGAIDVNHDVARTIRATMASVDRDSWLVAEHMYDATDDLRGDGWHGVMAYTWFTRPAWSWLATPGSLLMGIPAGVPDIDGPAFVRTYQALTAGVPWRSVTASMTLLDSHDTARFSSMARSPQCHHVALGLLFTMPGVPMVFAGDEVGVHGGSSDLARQPFPWDTSVWDTALFEVTKALVSARRSSEALQHGALRWVAAEADVVAFVRETAGERLLIQATRAAQAPIALDALALGVSGSPETMYGGVDLDVVGDVVTLHADGPSFHIWRISRPDRTAINTHPPKADH